MNAATVPPLPPHKSLRARGLLATLALLLYVVVAGLYVAGERDRIHASVQAMTELSRHEKALALLSLCALAGSLAALTVAVLFTKPQLA